MRSPMTADCFAGETSVVVLVIYRLEGREGAPCSPCRRIFCLAHRSIVDQPRPALVVNRLLLRLSATDLLILNHSFASRIHSFLTFAADGGASSTAFLLPSAALPSLCSSNEPSNSAKRALR